MGAPVPLSVGGLSLGGVETCIDVPELKLCFDLGRCPDFAVNRRTVLLTHAHMDHMGGIAWHCATRALRRMPPPTYVVPREDELALQGLFESWRLLDRSELPHSLVAVGPGDALPLSGELVARPFRSPHRVPCQGYALWRRKKHLRAEFRGLSGAEIRELRVGRGVEVEEVVETPELVFTGDTRIEVVEREEVVRTARVLVMETTFLDDRVSVELCRAKGHVHLDEVIERADLFQNEAIVLTHFSARYTPAEVRALLAARLPAALRERVRPLLPAAPGERSLAHG